MHKHRLTVCLAAAVTLSGCGSIAKGVTEAVLESGEEPENMCLVQGPKSDGLADLVKAQAPEGVRAEPDRTMKVLLVHGIGEHKPGYSARLRHNLADRLHLYGHYVDDRQIPIVHRREDKQTLGSLTLSRYLDASKKHRLIFYELTWSESVKEERKRLAYDTSREYAGNRTGVNNSVKQFFNARVVDPILYIGNKDAKERIRESVRHSICYMVRDGWESLPNEEPVQACRPRDVKDLGHATNDDFVFITHSLGSAIVIDALEDIVKGPWYVDSATMAEPDDDTAVMAKLREIFRNKEIKVYMMANQLPLLKVTRIQSGMESDERQRHEANCQIPDKRVIQRTWIYAFSDPNDILSYEIPPDFADEHLDPRLCATITNIRLNVAKQYSVFGVEFAHPEEAHNDYDDDQRVIALMADGIDRESQNEITAGRCEWTTSIDPNAGETDVAGGMFQ